MRKVFDAEWCARMNAAVERLLSNPGKRAREAANGDDPGRFHMNVFMWRWDPDFREFALNSPLPELAAQLLDCDAVSCSLTRPSSRSRAPKQSPTGTRTCLSGRPGATTSSRCGSR